MKKLLSTLLLSSFLYSASGCTKTQVTAGENAAIDCAKADLGQTVESAGLSVLMTVMSIIFDGGVNWVGDLAAIGAKYGPEVLACAEKVAEAAFRTPSTGSGAGSGLSTGAEAVSPHDRAVQALSGKSFK